MSDKKIANLHYPGIKPDPNEGATALPPEAAAHFNEQMICLGEQVQRELLGRSAFIISTTPLAVRLAKKLMYAGLGRVGLFCDQAVLGAHELLTGTSVLSAMSAWAKSHTPWAEFESYSTESIDRRLDDMVRGFDVVIGAGAAAETKLACTLARAHGKDAFGVSVAGRRGWYAVMPSNLVCEDCIALPDLKDAGLYYPLLEELASKTANLVVSTALGAKSSAAILAEAGVGKTVFSSKPNCSKCSKA